MVVVQGESLDRSRIATVVCMPLTGNTRWADAPGNVLLPASASGPARNSVANASLIVALDRSTLTERVGRLAPKRLAELPTGIDRMLSR